jgi:hypothetical protein
MADKLIQIAELVYDQTLRGELKWEKTPDFSTFQTSFPSYSILIQDSRDTIVFKICNEEAQVIEQLSEAQASNSGFSNMRDLYLAARRAAMGVDQALDEILKNLERGRAQ